MEIRGNSLLETKRKNRVLIKNEIYYGTHPTRAEIARSLGLTKATITTSVNEMIADGYVSEEPMPLDEMTASKGRRPLMLSFQGSYAYAIGVEVGPYSTEAVLMDLGGNVVRHFAGNSLSNDYTEMLEGVKTLINEVMPEDPHKLLGIGVGLPGFVDTEKGVIRTAPRAHWDNAPFAEDLQKSTGFPVLIDNNVRFRARGFEMTHKEYQGEMFAYFYISKGLACPIMIGRDSVAGYSSGAGEIGHIVMKVQRDGKERFFTADDLASETAVMGNAQRLLLKDTFPELQEIIAQKGRFELSDVMALEEKGSSGAKEAVLRAVEYAGVTMANVVNMLNPGIVVVDAHLMKLPENREHLLHTARSHFYGLNEQEVQVVFLEHRKINGAIGAACAIIKRYFLDQ